MIAKSTTSSKVRNKNLNFKNGKNEQAESMMKSAFEPLFSSKDNKARLTFCGVEHSLLEWTENGKQKEAPVMKLVFSVLDITHESPTTIALTCNYSISERNLLGRTLKKMGFQFKNETVTIDEDDEFGIRTESVKPSDIFDFLRGQCGLVYKGNLSVALRKDKKTGEKVEKPGIWDIVADTLEPKILKNGQQERDMMSSDISDEDFSNPDIAMESEAA